LLNIRQPKKEKKRKFLQDLRISLLITVYKQFYEINLINDADDDDSRYTAFY